jgi:hypothetical protein
LKAARLFLEKRKMFKLAQVRKIEWPVDVHIPQDGGKVQRQRFTGHFELLDQDEYKSRVDEGDLPERVFVGWGADLKGEAGDEPLEVNESNKAALLKIVYVRAAVLRAYLQASSGQEAARKN